MRICAVSLYPPTIAGTADYGAHLVHALAQDGRVEQITVLANTAPGAPAAELNDRVTVSRCWEVDHAGNGPALIGAVRRARPDAVWVNLGLTMFGTSFRSVASGLTAVWILQRLGYRTVVTLHELPALANMAALGLGGWPRRLGATVATLMALQANVVAVTLDQYRRLLVKRYGARHVCHIPHGAWNQPERLRETDGQCVLVFGTFGPHKDPRLVADAVLQLRQHWARLRLIVAGADHYRYPGFTSACFPRALNEDCEWLGYVPPEQLRSVFGVATVVVLPTRAASGSSGVIYRAAGFGRPVIVADLPDYRALASEEDLRLAWYAPGDAGALGRAIGELLGDPAHRSTLAMHNLRSLARLGPSATASAYLAALAGSRERPGDRSSLPTEAV